MRWLKRILILLLILPGLGLVSGYLFLQHQKPEYSGTLKMPGLHQPVDIYFDGYGIPHIYAGNEEDLYFALGYVHAQDRLFQMELLRRVSAGRLAEIFGEKLADTDRFFRMLGLDVHADMSAEAFYNDTSSAYKRAAEAYVAGINLFIEDGPTPVEFLLAGIPKEKFTLRDLFLVSDYMSFNFSMGYRTDPLMTRIRNKTGEAYLQDLAMEYVPGTPLAPVSSQPAGTPDNILGTVLSQLPLPVWTGSNGWVLSPGRSASGKVLFSNDAHIGFSQPCVWYEAHLECPGFSFYGDHLAGFPFAAIGHSRRHAWGLTMFENDDMDFYAEKMNPGDSTQVMYKGAWVKLQRRRETIHVKGAADLVQDIRLTPHGPLCNGVLKGLDDSLGPVSVFWTYTQNPSNLLRVMYSLAHSASMADFQESVAAIDGPGVNVMYGDAEGNIAWWAAARLLHRAAGVNPAMVLDGASGNDDPLGYYDFSVNPKSVNPPGGWVASANSQPDALPGTELYPGYYTPADRFRRITAMLQAKEKFTRQEMESMQFDDRSQGCTELAGLLCKTIYASNASLSSQEEVALKTLLHWDGNHGAASAEPVLYYDWLYRILHRTFADEMGEDDFDAFLLTHVMKNSLPRLLADPGSPWWDDIRTKDKKEDEAGILVAALKESLQVLDSALGPDLDAWRWSEVHTVTHAHAMGKVWLLGKFFNVGPFPCSGGNETINQMAFDLNGSGRQSVRFGPSMRITIDFADVENSRSILPTGNSGNVMSPFYQDQARLFIEGQTRKQMMNRQEIIQNSPNKLTLQPEDPSFK